MAIIPIQRFDYSHFIVYNSCKYIININFYIYIFQTTHKNGVVNGTDKSPCKHCEDDEFNLKPVSSVREFLENWKTASQKNNFEIYNKLLRCIKPNDLPKGMYASFSLYDY